MDYDEPHLTPNEKTQLIQWTERPTGALMATDSLCPFPYSSFNQWFKKYKECIILIFKTGFYYICLFSIFWSRGVWPTRPFCFFSCIMLMGQDSRPIHMSHLICSKLVLVWKVKQNNSRFSFALPWFIKPKSWSNTNGVVYKFVICSNSILLYNVLAKNLLLSTVAICKHPHWWSFDVMWKELGSVVGLK